MLVIGLPMLFLSGLKETYVSTVWTLAYRELNSGEVLEGTADCRTARAGSGRGC